MRHGLALLLAQQIMASRCDELLERMGEAPRPRLIELHREIARRYRSSIEGARREPLRYYRRDFRRFWIRGIASAREDLVAWLEEAVQVDEAACRAHGVELQRRLEQGWLYLRQQGLDRLP